jgi:hypothetical protein
MADRRETTRTSRSAPKRIAAPSGHTLAEFRPLSSAEAELLKASRAGRIAQIGLEVPESESDANSVRAGFLRFLALGGDMAAPIHAAGVQLVGAWVSGLLDLSASTLKSRLGLALCNIPKVIYAQTTIGTSINLMNSQIAGLKADGLVLSGDLLLREKFISKGQIVLAGAEIGGDLDLHGATLESAEDVALHAPNIKIKGNAFLCDGFSANGKVDLSNSEITGNLDLESSAISLPKKVAISLNKIEVSGHVWLGKDAKIVGGVSIDSAHVAGNLNFSNGSFSNSGRMAINCFAATIDGIINFSSVTAVQGSINFSGTKVGALIDDIESWCKADDIVLDGFEYRRFLGQDTPLDGPTRVRWLLLQKAEQYGTPFWPQPWEHLAKVLREMGHYEDAKTVSVEKQKEIRRCGLIGARRITPESDSFAKFGTKWWISVSNIAARGLHWFYGALAGYGYRPIKTAGWMVASWLIGSCVYFVAAEDGLMAPANPRIYMDPALASCGTGGDAGKSVWTRCAALPAEYGTFSPWIYSLDVSLPVVDLHQESEWRPVDRNHAGRALRAAEFLQVFVWLQIVFGWLTSLLMVSALGRLIQGDK